MEKKFTWTTGGCTLNNRLFSVKSSTRNVADIIISLRGFPCCKEKSNI